MSTLARRYPALHTALPRLALAELPTAVHPAESLSQALGFDRLWIKADDASARAYGGNKVRKLEYLLGDAQQRGCDAVLTYGLPGSNHALATAVHAKRVGLQCYAVLVGQMTPADQHKLDHHAQLGTRLIRLTDFAKADTQAAEAKARHPGGADRVYEIPWGGSSWLGAVGFVDAGLELAGQIEAGSCPAPDRLYIACGTTGSAVGLALGLRLAGLRTPIHAVCVTPPAVSSPQRFAELFDRINAELHSRDPGFPRLDEPLANVQLRSEFFTDSPRFDDAATRRAIEQAQEHEGIRLDPTYTGKAMAVLIDDARQGSLNDRNVLFWNTCNSRPWPANPG